MKKKLLAVLLAAGMVFSMTACGDDESKEIEKDGDDFVLSEADLSSYITLNKDYDVFNVEIDAIEVTDADVDSEIDNLIADAAGTSEDILKIVNRAVENGDTVNIDYVGTMDGVQFEGGTSYTSTNLTIGSGSFIEGFEEGLIGEMPGEVVTLNLTFSENYSEEMAGKDAQFEVTIHGILPEYADLTDENAPQLYEGIATLSDLREKVYDDIYQSIYASSVEYAVVEMIDSQCVFAESLPQALIDVSYENIMTNIATYAAYYGLDTETYIYFSYYQDLETFQNETAWELAEYNARYLLFCQAYANEKGLNITETELNEQLEASAAYYGYETVEGNFTEQEIDSIKNTLMNIKVLDEIVAKANVTIKTQDETETE